jgi:mRNA interferase YafQ
MMKSGRDISKLDDVIRMLAEEKILPPKYKDHQLKVNLSHMRECHVERDWLLLYYIGGGSLVLADSGTHKE